MKRMSTSFFNICVVIVAGFIIGYNLFPIQQESPQARYQAWQNVADLTDELFGTVRDDKCYVSKYSFLGCVNAINSIAKELNDQELSFNGKFIKSSNQTEKKILNSWEPKYEGEKIKFSEIILELTLKFPAEKKNYYNAIGVNGYLNVVVDPHTYLIPTKTALDNMSSMNKNFGLQLDQKSKGQYFLRKVPQGSLFDKQGFKKGDQILKIYGQKVSELTISQILTKVLSSEYNYIELEFVRDGQTLNSKFPKEFVEYSEVDLEVNENFAVIGIQKFATNTCNEVLKLTKKVKASHIKNLVLDLRNNPGGSVEASLCIASIFLPDNTLVFKLYEYDKKKVESHFSNKVQVYKGRLFILTNSSSASASELLAGALQYHQRAVVIGQRSFGKGSFQQGTSFLSGVALFKTGGIYLLPSGKSPQNVGITPDYLIKSQVKEVVRESENYYKTVFVEGMVEGYKKTNSKELSFNSKDDEILMVEKLIKEKIATK